MSLLHIIPILLTLGSQPDCDGFGMCIIERESEITISECMKYENCIQAEMDFVEKELILIVSQSKIKDKAFIKYFTKQNFELDKDYTLPQDIAQELNCGTNLTIPKGNYPINEENGKIVVRFKF